MEEIIQAVQTKGAEGKTIHKWKVSVPWLDKKVAIPIRAVIPEYAGSEPTRFLVDITSPFRLLASHHDYDRLCEMVTAAIKKRNKKHKWKPMLLVTTNGGEWLTRLECRRIQVAVLDGVDVAWRDRKHFRAVHAGTIDTGKIRQHYKPKDYDVVSVIPDTATNRRRLDGLIRRLAADQKKLQERMMPHKIMATLRSY